MCGCFKCAPSCICSCHRPPFSLRTYHLHTETGAVHCDQRALTYSSRDTCPVYAKVPVVVIDPEDREQVERFRAACYGDKPGGYCECCDGGVERTQTALRSLIEPPKPDEPTGRYAVVVDTKGDEWLRTSEGPPAPWLKSGAFTAEQWTDYADIAAVRVLSEGVSDV